MTDNISDVIRDMEFELSSLSTWTKPGYRPVNITRVRDTERKIRRWKNELEQVVKAGGEAQQV